MIYESSCLEEKSVLSTAARMCVAARTAPKAHGRDTLHTLVLTGEDKERLAGKMEEIGARLMGDKMHTWYGRDADNVRAAQAVVLIGAERRPRGVPNCGCCGFKDCGDCAAHGGRCAMIHMDLGIAVSSAVAVAAADMVDNRIMFSVGRSAGEMDYDENVEWLGIPLSVSGKNIFFDRGIFHD